MGCTLTSSIGYRWLPPRVPLAVPQPVPRRSSMTDDLNHRKQVRHFDEPGHFHELTFSCFHRLPLLTNDVWRILLGRRIDQAAGKWGFGVAAFVYMPEHVHLLVYPNSNESRVHHLLKGIEQPFSKEIRRLLRASGSRLIERLTVQERPGKTTFRFWQEGGGYDRNLTSPTSILAAIDYIHLNPVRRGLVRSAIDWRWSSCRFYARHECDDALPRIDGVPWEATLGYGNLAASASRRHWLRHSQWNPSESSSCKPG